jgi:hypothetical protein
MASIYGLIVESVPSRLHSMRDRSRSIDEAAHTGVALQGLNPLSHRFDA